RVEHSLVARTRRARPVVLRNDRRADAARPRGARKVKRERGLACAADREIADAHHARGDGTGPTPAARIGATPCLPGRGVERLRRREQCLAHAGGHSFHAARRPTARRAAPRISSATCRAAPAWRSRSAASPSRVASADTNSVPGAATRTARHGHDLPWRPQAEWEIEPGAREEAGLAGPQAAQYEQRAIGREAEGGARPPHAGCAPRERVVLEIADDFCALGRGAERAPAP